MLAARHNHVDHRCSIAALLCQERDKSRSFTHSQYHAAPHCQSSVDWSAKLIDLQAVGSPSFRTGSGAEIGRYRRSTTMITATKSTSTTPWTTANGGSAGGTLGASACRAGTFRKDWITRTKMLR